MLREPDKKKYRLNDCIYVKLENDRNHIPLPEEMKREGEWKDLQRDLKVYVQYPECIQFPGHGHMRAHM